MVCKACGKELYDNEAGRFRCPFCGAEVFGSGSAEDPSAAQTSETPEERVRRLEQENARLKLKTEIESSCAAEHFWRIGNIFSMIYRQSARNALERGDLRAAKRYAEKASVATDVGCLLSIIAFIVFVAILARIR